MNSVTNETGVKAFVTAARVERARRVKINSSGQVLHAGLAERADGVSLNEGDSGDTITVALRNKPGTVKLTAAGGFAVGAELYSAAAGKVDDVSTSAGNKAFLALEAATADGDIVECLPLHAESA